MEISFSSLGIRNIQSWKWQRGPFQGDIEETRTHRGPGDWWGCQGRDNCQEIGLKVKLASSSLSLHDLRAHHHLFMYSYCPTMSTPCKVFLDLPVCIQRAAAKIVVLADGLDHIIPPFTPPWQLPFPAPIAQRSSSPSQPLIIPLCSALSPMQQSSLPIPTSPFTLSALPHTCQQRPGSVCEAPAPPRSSAVSPQPQPQRRARELPLCPPRAGHGTGRDRPVLAGAEGQHRGKRPRDGPGNVWSEHQGKSLRWKSCPGQRCSHRPGCSAIVGVRQRGTQVIGDPGSAG